MIPAMRKTYLAGAVAGALVFTTLVPVPAFAQTDTTGASNAANNDKPASNDNATGTTNPDGEKALVDAAKAFQDLSDASGSANKDGAGSSSDLKLDPENDPLYIDPEKNPLKKVSSSEMFLEVTGKPANGEDPNVAQAWAANSSIPDTANPIELLKQEAQGSSMMWEGLFTGDFAMSSAGSSQATSVWLSTVIGIAVIGQIIELIMRGIRMAQR